MEQSAIAISFRPETASLTVERGEGVPDTFWLQARAEWGSMGKNPSRAIEVPIERFVPGLAWLRPSCERYLVGIKWEAGARQLVDRISQDRRVLEGILRGKEPFEVEGFDDTLVEGGFARELLPFQLRDLYRLVNLPHGANFSVPGAGKTAVTYALFAINRARGHLARLLVVAPVSAYAAWTEEASKCFPVPPLIHRFVGDPIPAQADVVLVNYHRLQAAYRDLAEWVSRKPSQVVLDEAHRIKRGWAGQWGSACLSLSFLAKRRDVLTGTPAPQSVRDLWSLFEYLWPGQVTGVLGDKSRAADGKEAAPAQLAQRIRPLFVRTTKSELSLPPASHRSQILPLRGLQAEIYAALRDRYVGPYVLGQRERVTFAQMGVVVMYLLEAATNPALLVAGSSPHDPVAFSHPPLEIPPESSLADLIRAYGSYETPTKFIELSRLVRENSTLGRKTVVWSSFVRNLVTLERLLRDHEPAVIHGGIPTEDADTGSRPTREQELKRFRNEDSCRVLLANPAATAEGISLHDVCHDAIYIDRTFNAGHYLQSIDRIHRLGLLPGTKTTITYLLTKGTVDEVVHERLGEKAKVLGTLLSDPDVVTMTLPDEEEHGDVLDEDRDVAAVISHLQARTDDSADT
jgi:SNF2 family DNA or RNA helicase